MKTLKKVQIEDTATVVKLHGTGTMKRGVMNMGIIKGTQVFVCKVAPLGDPIEAKARDYELSLRKVGAELTEVD